MLVGRLPGAIELTAGQSSYSVEILIRDEAFLHVGAQFAVNLTEVKLGNKGIAVTLLQAPTLTKHFKQ
jgi:hypothetical protein